MTAQCSVPVLWVRLVDLPAESGSMLFKVVFFVSSDLAQRSLLKGKWFVGVWCRVWRTFAYVHVFTVVPISTFP